MSCSTAAAFCFLSCFFSNWRTKRGSFAFWVHSSRVPFAIASSRVSGLQALLIGFLLFNVLAVGALLGWAFISFDWVAGLFWMMAKSYVFVLVFVQMRATFPRVRVDQLMGFAWKWLLPAALINIFATAIAVSILANG